jgi:hypothetical protein
VSRVLGAWAVSLFLVTAACGGKAFYFPKKKKSAGAGGATTTVTSSSSGGQGGSGAGQVYTSLDEIDLGDHPSGATLALDIPSALLGFTVVVRSQTPQGRMGVRSLVSPSQQAVIDNYFIQGTNWQFSWFGTTPAAVPQSDAASAMPKVAAGKWQLAIGDPTNGSGAAHVSVWLRKSSDGAFHGGSVDVNVFRIPDVSSAAYLDGVLASALNGWAGMKLGKISDRALDKAFATVNKNNFFQVIEESKAASNTPALNVFVVAKLTDDFVNVGGISAGIPGLGVAPGSRSSGLVMVTHDDPQIDALIIRHEAGHLAGLFHTTEVKAGYFDALGDTPTCGSVVGMMFNCPDATNIMFPIAAPGATKLSPMQQAVIRGSTLYRGAYDGTPSDEVIGKAHGSAEDPAPPTTSSSSAAWRTRIDTRAADLLSAHWCAQGAVDHAVLVAQLASREDLKALSTDPSAPVWIRARAAAAAGVTR